MKSTLVRLGLFALLVILLTSTTLVQAQTVSEMAVSSYVRPDYAPKYSDVCFSSRWPRGQDYRTAETFWGSSEPFDTITVLQMYHATRLDWIYVRGLEEIAFVPKVRALGVSVSAAQTSNLHDDYGGNGTRLIGRILNSDGSFELDGFNSARGCVFNEDFKAIYLREMKLRIDAGATDLQVDDPTLNDGSHCFCAYCQGTKDGFEATTEFYTWLHNELDAYYLQQYGIDKFPIHGNNTSRSRYTDSYFKDIVDYRLDYGLGECDWKYLSAQHLHNVSLLARTYEGGDRAQVITAPGKPMEDKNIAWYQALTRRHIATCYAQGMHPIVPFDRYDCEPPGAGDEVQNERFYGNPQNYADLYGFVRGIAIYLDDYEWAWDYGKTPAAEEYETGPHGPTWGTPPAATEPVTAVDDGVAVVIRAQPGANDDPIAIHLVQWDNPNSFSITLRNDKFFGQSSDNLRLTLLQPLANYDADDYAMTWANLNYTYYVEQTVLTGSYNAGTTTVTIPPLNPWAVLMVSKGKTTPLVLTDSPRWQQLRDEAPAIATPSSPAGNTIVGPTQPIVLSFDKEMNTPTVNATNIIVKHEESGEEISGSWSTIGTLALFNPSTSYKKGTISVQLTPSVQRANGVGCLRQIFYYDFDLDICDVTLDQIVDLDDYEMLSSNWHTAAPDADMSGDGYVSDADLYMLTDSWLTCYTPTPEIILPGPDNMWTGLQPTFAWEDVASSYDIYLGTDFDAVNNADYASPEYVTTVSAASYVPTEALLEQTQYFWRVDAVGPKCSAHGAVNSFTTTSNQTLGYWELDGNGNAAVGGRNLTLHAGTETADTTNVASISNPDLSLPWLGTDSAAANQASLDFDGATAYQHSSGNSPFQFKRSSPFTAEAYIRPTGGVDSNNIIFGTRDGFSYWRGWYLKYDANAQRLNLYHVHIFGTTNVYTTSNVLPLNEMHHVALVWDPSQGIYGEMRLYVDGNVVSTIEGKSYWDDRLLCGWNFLVGGRAHDDPWAFVGQIDEVRWTPTALAPTDFLCGVPNAPEPASNPTPADSDTGVNRGPVLSWTAGARAQTHDVYFGTTSPPAFQENTAAQSYAPGALEPFTTYYWRIDERNDQGVATGDIWSFTTSDELVLPATDTLAYWELDGGGSPALSSYQLSLSQGALTTDATHLAIITNPDQTSGWSGTDSPAQNTLSLTFDGSTALTHQAVDNTFALTRDDPFTCEAYVRPTGGTGSTNVVFGNRDSVSGWKGWYLRYNVDLKQLLFYMQHPITGDLVVGGGGNSVPVNSMHHVAVVWDPSAGSTGQMTVYVDGQVDIRFDGDAAWDNTPVGKNFMVGGRDNINTWGFIGQIDEVRWVGRALQPYEFLNAQ